MKPILLCFLFFTFYTPLSAQKTQLNHIAVYVTNLAKSSSFYEQVIGLDTIPEPFKLGKHKWFKIGPQQQLHLIVGLTTISVKEKNTHLCFSVPDLKNFIKKITTEKIKFEDWLGNTNKITTRVDGVQQIYLQDPDGYWIEINDDYPPLTNQ